ncbi:MAG: phosphoglucosamine mutase [Candidatus Diapherotrites archaeon]|uniref:Phosphoglucosamine mutase n=1 Tax=Candidatus Iainarchaeum sp. TaxID=3101447 RepID=A0A2D6LPW3_9ARCH|nr:phosphoglucosamine mutase [Candidatus Diapherotrites archaeon]|tara:strand:- start:3195 stop:4541 length:1347 start_codon:yes stop_codon:yes gene_type:complete
MSERKLFGTDGIRGKANEYPMTPEVALRVGKAVASIFRNNGKHSIVIGKDTRRSGYMLETALTAGIVSMGVDVFLVGPMPTPAIAKLTTSLSADAGIVLSASHNPADDNGIKIFDSEGYKLSDETEHKIESIVLSDEEIKNSDGTVGKAFRIDEAQGRYIEFAKSTVKNIHLSGLKLVLDCANGAGYSVAPKIFSELGAEVITLFHKPDGNNINDGCGALFPEKMSEKVKEHKADLGIALDGDADRAIVCNELGEIVHGDAILALAAVELKKRNKLANDTAVITIMSNLGLHKFLEKNEIKPVSVKVGDRYVIEEMRKNNYTFGGEQSGHIVFGDYTTTGDGIISALQLLRLMKVTEKKLSELVSPLEFFPQLLVNVKVKEKKPFSELFGVEEKIKAAEKDLGSDGRIIVRYSGTENIARIMVEGKNEEEIKKISDSISEAISTEIGE